ncbi:uncharacterized SAM-binding protein YcdF (DUF218 family) [Streptococcus gallinaceus]|uniref:YdcF family protein n=1 Tax=Streptococcus gallinaceus TaxID=165758 RepID=UPI00209E7164|nr:YdcF family protein [Streptococcus gallinaceus]MCP1638912.1 uncharacterized SAM-binding protein YcdF (DUF218 family) [Streptococcus gallinaceus]MCP1769844.1 uncharacterized SAM-binding protein YcdF (DUF218 family) [Streptococcus gallinaceus]
MILHLFWGVPFLIFLLLFIVDSRHLLNAYLFLISFILFVIVLAGYFVIQVERWDQQLAIAILIWGLLLIPLSIVFSTVYLFFNGKQMLTFEGRRFANLLSLFYGVVIVLVILLHFLPSYFITMKLINLVDALLFYGSFLYLSYMIYGLVYNLFPITYQPDYIVVLGSGLIGDKIPPLLEQRLEKGIFYYEKFDKRPNIIVSGGQGSDETISEAQAMAQYLLAKGIKQEKLLVENKSTTMLENLTFSRRLVVEKIKGTPRFLVVTNSFHSLRAGIYMRKLGLKGRSVGSKTAFYYLPSAWLRETIGLVVIYWKWHVVIVGFYLASWFISFFV